MRFSVSIPVMTAVLALSAATAHAEQITFVSQGGAYQEAQTKAILIRRPSCSASPSTRTAPPMRGRF